MSDTPIYDSCLNSQSSIEHSRLREEFPRVERELTDIRDKHEGLLERFDVIEGRMMHEIGNALELKDENRGLKEKLRYRDKKIEELNQIIKRLELESDSDALLCAYMRGVSDGRERSPLMASGGCP